MSDGYKEALEQAQTELHLLEERRANLLRLIATLTALSQDELYELTPPPGYEPEGMTAEIRKILSLTTVHLAATQIRDSLVQRGFSNEKPKNLLISVHTVLGRIEKELDVTERDGKSAYKAKMPTLRDMNPGSNFLAEYAKQLAATAPVAKEAMEYYQKVVAEALRSISDASRRAQTLKSMTGTTQKVEK